MYARVAVRCVTISLVECHGVTYHNTRANIICLIIDRFIHSSGAARCKLRANCAAAGLLFSRQIQCSSR